MASRSNTLSKRVKEQEIVEEVHHRQGPPLTKKEIASRERKRYLGFVLIPACMFVLLVFGEMLNRMFSSEGILRQMTMEDLQGFWFFIAGCVCWLAMLWCRLKPTLAYVFAHEITHALAAKASLGEIHDMHISRSGGYVETNKTNWFITLAPYLVPLYTLIVFALLELGRAFYNVDYAYPLALGAWHPHLKAAWIFYYWIGLTWSFHVSFTWEVLKTEQSDLLHNGEFFSLLLIFGANLGILVALFFLASPKFTFHDLWLDVQSGGAIIWDVIAFVFQTVYHILRNDG